MLSVALQAAEILWVDVIRAGVRSFAVVGLLAVGVIVVTLLVTSGPA